MTELSRAEFMALTGYDRVGFDARARRGQFPFLLNRTGSDLPYRVYQAMDALNTMLADDMHERLGLPLDTACALAINATDRIVPRWEAVCSTSADELAGRACEHLLCGGVQIRRETSRRIVESWQPLFGSPSEIGVALAHWSPVAAVALVNITLIAADLRRRATRAKIDISDLWRGTAR